MKPFPLVLSLFVALLFLLSSPVCAAGHYFAPYRDKGIVVAQEADMAPMSFIGMDGQPQGFIIDLWHKWSAETGVPVSFHLVDWADTLTAVRDGRADVHGGLFFTDERDRFLDYTAPIFPSSGGAYVKKDSGILELSQLNGRRVGVIESSFFDYYMQHNYPEMKPVRYKTSLELAKAAISGDVPASVGDYPTIMYQIGSLGKASEFTILDFSGDQLFRAAVAEGNTALLEMVEHGLEMVDQNERDSIFNRWVMSPSVSSQSWLVPAASVALGCLLLAILVPFLGSRFRR